jgi:ATP-grasp ribosomal peptide maturase
MRLAPDPTAGSVLVLTEPADKTADLVIEELDRRSTRVIRLDAGDFPLSLYVNAWFDGAWRGEIGTPDGSVDLRDVRSIYLRRPTGFIFPPSMNEAEQRFAAREARRGFGGLLTSLPCSWVNHPSRTADAEYKPLQLATAAACGLDVPRTVITNDPDSAGKHSAHLGSSVIYKTFASASVADGKKVALIYANSVTVTDMADSRVALTAHQFQQCVPKVRDVRATVVGKHVFAANILGGDLTSGGLLDWRADYDALRYEPVNLPHDVQTALLTMTEALGLSFATVDFVVAADGRHYFLDLNPNGQWGWLQEATGLPIAAAIAAHLTGEDQ